MVVDNTGDAIIFVCKVFRSCTSSHSWTKIASDFGLNYDATNRAPPDIAPRKTPEQYFMRNRGGPHFRVLSESYHHLLKEIGNKYTKRAWMRNCIPPRSLEYQ